MAADPTPEELAAAAAAAEAEAKAAEDAAAIAAAKSSKTKTSPAVYAVCAITPGFQPGDRIDGKLTADQLDVLIRQGDASRTPPA